MRTPTVTVIALCYNHERFVLDCLESIRAQTFQDFELIVIDDCSRDHSPQVIANWLAEHYPAARFIRHEVNRGI
jgi:glycosyltransferase involved in cell wall biosynthesis